MQAVRGSMTGGLKANSLSFFESLVMGVAGSAPGYTIAVTTAVLLASAGSFGARCTGDLRRSHAGHRFRLSRAQQAGR